jgi:hypothetical protein
MNPSDPYYIAISAVAVVVTLVVTMVTIYFNQKSVKDQLESQATNTAAQLSSQAASLRAQLASQADLTRTQLLADMISRGLAFFGGGSQKRSIGIAALQIVEKDEAIWPHYRDAVASLLYAQLLYLFAHGSNRWESHEITNIVSMTDWLIDPTAFPELSADRKKLLSKEMKVYLNEANSHGRTPAIDHIVGKLDGWQQRLGEAT